MSAPPRTPLSLPSCLTLQTDLPPAPPQQWLPTPPTPQAPGRQGRGKMVPCMRLQPPKPETRIAYGGPPIQGCGVGRVREALLRGGQGEISLERKTRG